MNMGRSYCEYAYRYSYIWSNNSSCFGGWALDLYSLWNVSGSQLLMRETCPLALYQTRLTRLVSMQNLRDDSAWPWAGLDSAIGVSQHPLSLSREPRFSSPSMQCFSKLLPSPQLFSKPIQMSASEVLLEPHPGFYLLGCCVLINFL